MVKKVIYILIAAGAIILAVIQLRSNKADTQDRVYQFDKDKPIGVNVLRIKPELSESRYSYPGTFEPNKETRISAEIQGKVDEVLIELGSRVTKGQTLIQLDNSLLKLQLEAVNVQIEGLETDVKRYSVLAGAEAIQGVQLEKAELGLKSAQIQKATILQQIYKTAIKAPFSGIVTAKLAEEGVFAAPGVALLQITDISKLRFTVNIPENEIIRFRIGQKCGIRADVFPEILLEGSVNMIGSKANQGNSYAIQMILDNTSDLRIKSGMYGKADISTGENSRKIVVPASAMVGTSLQPQVYIVRNGKAVLQNITVAERRGNSIIVSEGLRENDLIVISGFVKLYDGASVNIKN